MTSFKTLFALAGILLLTNLARAQKPEPIYSFVRILKPLEWYKEQRTAWQKEISKNNKNAYAWYNYYRVCRNLASRDTTDTRSQKEKWDGLQNIVNDMEKKVPHSYEYNLCKWMSGGNNMELLPYLQKANELGPGRTEHLPDMGVVGEIERDIPKRDLYSAKWYNSGLFSPGILNYNYNVLCGLKPHAILITCGDNDTHPAWMLQSQGIRKDVTVINTSLILIDNYREKICKELGIAPWEIKFTGEESMDSFNNDIVKRLAANKNKYPVYVALTTGDLYTKANEDKLYLTGLAYEYNEDKIDNIALLKKNFEQVYKLDYIERYFYIDFSEPITQMTTCNYVVPLIKLYEHYKNAGEDERAKYCETLARAAAKGNYEEKELKKYFGKN